MKATLFFSNECPDTAPFFAELKRLGAPLDEIEQIEVQSSLPNLKRFLRLRDHNAIFDHAKANGFAGLPALQLEDGRVILDEKQLTEIFTK